MPGRGRIEKYLKSRCFFLNIIITWFGKDKQRDRIKREPAGEKLLSGSPIWYYDI